MCPATDILDAEAGEDIVLDGGSGSGLTLWGRVTSSNVQKVLWCCEEMGLDYTQVDVGREFGGNDEPWYLDMNPNGLVPTLGDGDLTIWESNTIIRYLADRYGGEALYSREYAPRTMVDRWLDWEIGTLAPAIFPLFWGLIRTPKDEQDPVALENARQKLIGMWTMLDSQLANRPFVAGDHLTLADIALGNSIYRWFNFPIERPDLPALKAWYDRLNERPGFQKFLVLPLA